MNEKWQDCLAEAGDDDELGANEMIASLGGAIETRGFDDVYDAIMNPEGGRFLLDDPMLGIHASPELLGPRFSGNPDSLVIIPGEHHVACAPVALTLINSRRSQWRSSRTGANWEHHDNWASELALKSEWRRWVMMRMKTHLICCERILRRVVVVTDHWDPQVFEQEHARELSAWHHRGKGFKFLLVTQQNGLSLLRVKL
jgi:hypothetical protein